ncbi:MAG: hypothetical protein JWO72_2602, partial [Caulobacteraceae bacterium]|nr:hypothetical protein [Caulobacteraceae bacterium]
MGVALGLVGQTAQAQPDLSCLIRKARSDTAWAAATVRVEKTSDNAFGGRGDHCDEQVVEGRVAGTLRGPLQEGQPIRFSLSQGACGMPDSVNDAFVEPGAELVVLFQRDAAGGVHQVRAESPAE